MTHDDSLKNPCMDLAWELMSDLAGARTLKMLARAAAPANLVPLSIVSSCLCLNSLCLTGVGPLQHVAHHVAQCGLGVDQVLSASDEEHLAGGQITGC